MKTESVVKFCKNKKCHKLLPEDYKYRYCESCRIKQAQTTKNVLKGIGAGATTVVSVAAVIITRGKISLKK